MKSHVIDYELIGSELQLVEVTLDPGEAVVAEAGTMTYIDPGIEFEARMGDGAEPDRGFFGKVFDAGKRVLTGESLFMTHFTNRGSTRQKLAFAAPYPGKIIPLHLDRHAGEILCQKDAFLCAALGTKVDIAFQKRLGAGFFGGEGFILQKLTGDGIAFVHAGGTVIERQLNGETLRVDTGCVVAFERTVQFDITGAGGLKTMIFGGEGIFLAALSGHGKVWIQSLPFSRLANTVLAHAPSAGGSRREEGGVLGGLGNVFGD